MRAEILPLNKVAVQAVRQVVREGEGCDGTSSHVLGIEHQKLGPAGDREDRRRSGDSGKEYGLVRSVALRRHESHREIEKCTRRKKSRSMGR